MIAIERPDAKPQQKQGGCGLAVVIFIVVMALAAMLLWSVDSPIFMCGWIVFFSWLEWFLIVKCGWRPHWWRGGVS